MIGFLSGHIHHIDHDSVLMVVEGGVGYDVYMTKLALAALSPGDHCSFYTHVVYREDDRILFAFATLRERQWFRLLLSAPGVGPKLALVMMGALSVDELAVAIEQKNTAVFKKVKGVGPRLAEKMVVDLEPKWRKMIPVWGGGMPAVQPEAPAEAAQPVINPMVQDVCLALEKLGYSSATVTGKVESLAKEHSSVSALLKASLRVLA